MKDNYLKEFLDIFWLRPETAILNALLAKNLPNNYLKDKVSADLSCGDGIFSFIANGGMIDKTFNYYKNTDISTNIIKNEDIYSCYDDTYNPKIITEAKNTYNYGIDINDKMLLKAQKLNIYQSLLEFKGKKYLNDGNDYPLSYVRSNESIDIKNQLDLVSVFSSIYMFPQTEYLLHKVKLILKDNGTFIVNTKTNMFRQFYEQMDSSYPKKFSTYIERDMRNILQKLHSEKEWEKLFIKSGFIIEKKIPTLSANLTPIWSIGLRFLTPLLVKMSNSIMNENDLLEIKNEFSSTFYEVLQEFYHQDIKEASSFLYILRKK